MPTGHSRLCNILNALSVLIPALRVDFENVNPTERHCARCDRHIHLSGMDEHSLLWSEGSAPLSPPDQRVALDGALVGFVGFGVERGSDIGAVVAPPVARI